MGRRSRTVRQLADEARLDPDAALVYLWDGGFGKLLNPTDVIHRGNLNRARRALGIATRRELESGSHWMKLLKMGDAEFTTLLEELGVPPKGQPQRLAYKAVARLRAEARKRGVDPITGRMTADDIGSIRTKLPSFTWRTPGHERELRWLNAEEVRAIHFELVNDFQGTSDPITPPGVRSESLLGSAAFGPMTSIGGTLKYPTVETSAAALLHSIIQDHPFHNGNKRTALVATLVFLDENGLFPDFNQDEVFKFVLQIAQHRVADISMGDLADREVLSIAEWLCARCRFLERGNRQIPYRKLRRILVGYECQLNGPFANRIDITRVVPVRRLFWRTNACLHTHLIYGGENREVTKSEIKRVRTDLHLDDEHGIDSHAFYSNERTMATEFIAHYRKTLRRLAKF